MLGAYLGLRPDEGSAANGAVIGGAAGNMTPALLPAAAAAASAGGAEPADGSTAPSPALTPTDAEAGNLAPPADMPAAARDRLAPDPATPQSDTTGASLTSAKLTSAGQPNPDTAQAAPTATDPATYASLQGAMAGNPDQAAEAVLLARRYRLPFDLVQRNLDQFRRRAQLDDATDAALGAPVLLRQLGDPAFAACAVDDVGVLAPLEQNIQQWGELKAWQPPAATAANVATGLYRSFGQGLDKVRLGLNMQADDLFSAIGIGSNQDPSSSNYWYRQRLARDYQQVQDDIRTSTPAFDSQTGQAIYDATSNTIRVAPAAAVALLTRNPAPLLASDALSTEADAYAGFRARGASGGTAFAGAAADGAISYVLNKLPVDWFLKRFGTAGMMRLLAGTVGRDVTAGQMQTLMQDAIDTAIANPKQTWGDFLKARPQAAYKALVSTLVQTALLGGADIATKGVVEPGDEPGTTPGSASASSSASSSASPSGTTPTTESAAPADVSLGATSGPQPPVPAADAGTAEVTPLHILATADAIGRATALASQSKLLQRDPVGFQQAVQQMADANGVSTLHISSGALMDALSGTNVDARAVLKHMPRVVAQLRDLPAQGGDLSIPTGELITGLANSGAATQILPHLRVTPAALSLSQLQQEMTDARIAHSVVENPAGVAAAGTDDRRLYGAADLLDRPAAYYFRGTSAGHVGNPSHQQTANTPTSWNPISATLFATEAEQHGSGVLHIATPPDLGHAAITGKNVLGDTEHEIGIGITPADFARQASLTVTAAQARAILRDMGIDMPSRIYSTRDLGQHLREMPEMSADQIEEFVNLARRAKAEESE